MKKFPNLDKYSDDDLIVLVHDEKDDWQEDAVNYAKKLLTDRGLSEEYSNDRIKEIRKETEILWKRELEERKTESYSIIVLIFMTFFWFKAIFQDWQLKRDGYHKMRNQRLIAISVGFLIYFSFVVYATSTSDEIKQERIAEINSLAELDSIANSQIDWSGKYTFIDSSSRSKDKVIWDLELRKENEKHLGTLSFKTKNKIQVVSCIGLIKDELLEFYPDTTYSLNNGIEISYYDKLFTFGRDSLETYTKWGKLNPFYSEPRTIDGYFCKNKSM